MPLGFWPVSCLIKMVECRGHLCGNRSHFHVQVRLVLMYALAYLEAGFWLINATLVKTDCMRNTRTRALAK